MVKEYIIQLWVEDEELVEDLNLLRTKINKKLENEDIEIWDLKEYKEFDLKKEINKFYGDAV